MTPMELDRLLRPLQMKDLRALCRARGMNPGGGKDELTEILKQHMLATGNFSMIISVDGGSTGHQGYGQAPQGAPDYTYGGTPERNASVGVTNNNYSRPSGQQNVGNFLTDKPSSRVLAPPGGGSTISFGDYVPPANQHGNGSSSSAYGGGYSNGNGASANPLQTNYAYGSTPERNLSSGVTNNNYSRPSGQQNVGNFITDKPSSRVLAPPGGASSITFGDYTPPSGYAASSASRPPLPPGGSPGGGYGGISNVGYSSNAGYGSNLGYGNGGGGAPPMQSGSPYGGYGGQQRTSGSGAPGASDPYGMHVDSNAPLSGVPIPMGYDSHFNPLQGAAGAAMVGSGQRIPSAGRRAGKPQPGPGSNILAGNYPDAGGSSERRQDSRLNNYARPGGQNVGNHITDRPSSRVLAPPGGRSQISFG